jgi:hypothetical protein
LAGPGSKWEVGLASGGHWDPYSGEQVVWTRQHAGVQALWVWEEALGVLRWQRARAEQGTSRRRQWWPRRGSVSCASRGEEEAFIAGNRSVGSFLASQGNHARWGLGMAGVRQRSGDVRGAQAKYDGVAVGGAAARSVCPACGCGTRGDGVLGVGVGAEPWDREVPAFVPGRPPARPTRPIARDVVRGRGLAWFKNKVALFDR